MYLSIMILDWIIENKFEYYNLLNDWKWNCMMCYCIKSKHKTLFLFEGNEIVTQLYVIVIVWIIFGIEFLWHPGRDINKIKE
jgi:hypothetical protein